MDSSKAAEPIRPTAEMRARFLDHLAATCDIAGAAAAVGVDPIVIHNMRRTNRWFRAGWVRALACGYETLETQMLGLVLAGIGDTKNVDSKLALALLQAHRARREAAPAESRAAEAKPATATAEQTDAAILRKLAAMRRGREGRA